MSHNQAPAREVGQPSDQVTKVGRERRRPPRTSGHVATKALEVEAQSDTESHLNDTADTILSSRSRTSHPKTHSQARRGPSGRAWRRPSSSEDLDPYPLTAAPSRGTPSTAKSHICN